MRPKSLILLVLALGCGLIAAIGINQVLANRPVEQAQDLGETVPIFIALMDIGLGDPLTPQVLKLEEWPKMKVPAGALMHLEDVEGRRARTKFYGGEPIIEAKLLAKGDQASGATDLIPKGFRVVSVKVDDVSGSGLILPGDRVDALVHLADPGGSYTEGNRASTHTFLHNVKVFAVNNVYSREANGTEAITAKTISLLVSPQQAELVTLANEMGKIRLVMRSADDETQEETDGVTQSELFKGGDNPLARKQAAAESFAKMLEPPKPAIVPVEPIPETPANSWKMVVIRGDTVDEFEFEDGSRVGSATQVRQLGTTTDSMTGAGPKTLPLGTSLGTPSMGTPTTPVSAPFNPPQSDDP